MFRALRRARQKQKYSFNNPASTSGRDSIESRAKSVSVELNVEREGLNDHWDSNQSIKKNKTYSLSLSLILNSLPFGSTKGSATND